ncbi:MAG: HAMP domain-containing histidine kinase [Pyrinomonadaceae bacterium]|nr:HAMP domain-containing histidine kinase [Pyrinomonadaceae bacterium]
MGELLSNNHTQPETTQREEAASESVLKADANQRVEQLIEQLKLRSAELEDANRELRRISHYRSLFLARMSHELRTPLTSILGFSEILLEQEELTATQSRFCKKIQDSGFQLQTSLNQLVDLSRLEGEHPEVFLQEFSLRDVLRESCAAVTRAAHMNQVRLEYDLAPEVTTVVSDQGKLRQILYNFLGWAVSRSSSGQVSVYADLIDGTLSPQRVFHPSRDARLGTPLCPAGDPGLIRIRIDDSGEHLADLSRVFDLEEPSGAREATVNELGIIISHRLIDLISGNVALQNRDAGGLRVLIQLPARPMKR